METKLGLPMMLGKVGGQRRALLKNVTLFLNSDLKYFCEMMDSEIVKNELRIHLVKGIIMGEEARSDFTKAGPSA